jgi:chaperone required for assembly of F1-ATPase
VRDPAITPRELAARQAGADAPAARPLAELTELYYAALWGDRATDEDERRARELAREIRATLEAARRAPR